VDGQGCDFWKSCFAVALRLIRPRESRAHDVQRDQRDDRGFTVRVDRAVECEEERLVLRPRAPTAGAMSVASKSAIKARSIWSTLGIIANSALSG
jgi:hypothetical protein